MINGICNSQQFSSSNIFLSITTFLRFRFSTDHYRPVWQFRAPPDLVPLYKSELVRTRCFDPSPLPNASSQRICIRASSSSTGAFVELISLLYHSPFRRMEPTEFADSAEPREPSEYLVHQPASFSSLLPTTSLACFFSTHLLCILFYGQLLSYSTSAGHYAPLLSLSPNPHQEVCSANTIRLSLA